MSYIYSAYFIFLFFKSAHAINIPKYGAIIPLYWYCINVNLSYFCTKEY